MSAKTRKTAGSFVSDSNDGIIQQSPRLDLKEIFERNPYTLASHVSKTNFIVDSVLPEGPRAFAVSQTGEKHSLHLDESVFNVNSPSPFSVATSTNVTTVANTSKESTMTIPDVTATNASSQESYTQLSNSASVTKIPSITIERPRLNSAKRSKGSRRYINQKPRPVFTPRNLEKILTPRISEERGKISAMHNYNAQTQTELVAIPKSRNYLTSAKHSGDCQKIPQRISRENVGDMLKPVPSRNIGPLRVVPPRKEAKVKDYSELRNIVSALTLITVVSWLFSTFFELDGISELFNTLAELLKSWFAKKEQPMTKAEMLVDYIRNWF